MARVSDAAKAVWMHGISLSGMLFSGGAAAPLLLWVLLGATSADAASFDIHFTCDYGCTAGVDAPIGSLIVLDADLGTPFDIVPIRCIEVAAFGLSGSGPGAGDDLGAPPSLVLDSAANPAAIDWASPRPRTLPASTPIPERPRNGSVIWDVFPSSRAPTEPTRSPSRFPSLMQRSSSRSD